ncbi:Cytochrome c oxidase subunit 2 [Thalassocella blandensis]|nr:Cytochrome c oxidase subunit 2 [Thalassocella blandensis]
MMRLKYTIRFIFLLLTAGLLGCKTEQSMFSSAGPYADSIVWLTHLMTYGAIAVTLFIMLLTGVALFAPDNWKRKLTSDKNIVVGGIVFPTVLLTILLIYGFILLANAEKIVRSSEALSIDVVGEQWWWRFIYTLPDGRKIETANELRIPVNRPVSLTLTTADVIHSFWIPAYGGKLDMIPGRENTLDIFVQQTGVFRGQCAEYCGGAHALMSMYSVAMLPSEFEQWLDKESQIASSAANAKGKDVFLANGCGSCHQVRGTTANGTVGPDLTHVGSRLSIGAGVLKVSKESFVQWIENHQRLKPDNLMPEYTFLTVEETQLIAEFLHGLQ